MKVVNNFQTGETVRVRDTNQTITILTIKGDIIIDTDGYCLTPEMLEPVKPTNPEPK